MEKFYSLFQTCAAATYLYKLWLSQDPSMNQSNRIYSQWKKADCLLLGQGRDEHSSQQEGLCPSSQKTQKEKGLVKVKPSPRSAAAGPPPLTPQQHTGNTQPVTTLLRIPVILSICLCKNGFGHSRSRQNTVRACTFQVNYLPF